MFTQNRRVKNDSPSNIRSKNQENEIKIQWRVWKVFEIAMSQNYFQWAWIRNIQLVSQNVGSCIIQSWFYLSKKGNITSYLFLLCILIFSKILLLFIITLLLLLQHNSLIVEFVFLFCLISLTLFYLKLNFRLLPELELK